MRHFTFLGEAPEVPSHSEVLSDTEAKDRGGPFPDHQILHFACKGKVTNCKVAASKEQDIGHDPDTACIPLRPYLCLSLLSEEKRNTHPDKEGKKVLASLFMTFFLSDS